MTRMLLSLVMGIVISGIPAYAHHSFAAYYHESQSISLEGTIHEFQYKSPHAIVVFHVADAGGRTQKYEAEWGNPSRLQRQGITATALRPGDLVRITGSPGRKASENKVHLKRIHRPSDGWTWGGNGRR
jgi:hypothetical protein